MIYLIYNKEEIEINQFSINKYIEGFNKYGIKCQLITTDDYKNATKLPRAVVNRTNNYKISTYFEKKGIRVFNNSFVTKICNNKEETYKYLGKEVKHLELFDKKDNLSFPFVVKVFLLILAVVFDCGTIL